MGLSDAAAQLERCICSRGHLCWSLSFSPKGQARECELDLLKCSFGNGIKSVSVKFI